MFLLFLKLICPWDSGDPLTIVEFGLLDCLNCSFVVPEAEELI